MDSDRELLVDAPGSWPTLEVRHAPPDGEAPLEDRVGPDRAELPLHGGWATVERAPYRVTFRLPARPGDGALIHPYLAPAAALAARWAGRESFHAGAVVVGDGAWVVLGDKESGKSTTLADLGVAGHDVLADDLVVLDGDAVLPGPRCIDLRAETAQHLGAGEPLGVVGARERWRLRLGPVPATVPLRGWITLAWGDEVGLEVVRGADRMLALLPFRAVQLEPEDPRVLVNLGSAPVLRLRRPRDWGSLALARARLVDAIAG